MGSNPEVTAYDIAKRYGITRKAAAEWLENRCRIGMYKKTLRLIKRDNNQRYWVAFYQLVESVQEPDHASSERTDGRRRRIRADRRTVLSVG